MTSGGLAAMGGAFLSIGFVHSFSQNMTAGRGFIALAALIFGRWRPGAALAATLLFGFGSALAQRLPVFSPSGAVLFQALPYVLTLIAVTGRDRPLDPAAQRWGARSRSPEFRCVAATWNPWRDEAVVGDRWHSGWCSPPAAHAEPDRFDLRTPGRAHRRARIPAPPPRRRRRRDAEAHEAGHARRAPGDQGLVGQPAPRPGRAPRRATSACRRRSPTTRPSWVALTTRGRGRGLQPRAAVRGEADRARAARPTTSSSASSG